MSSGCKDVNIDLRKDLDEYINKSQCPILIDNLQSYKDGAQEQFEEFSRIILENTPKYFVEGLFNREVYNKFYGSVITRCFGYGVPYTCMVPLGDFMNHNDKEANNYEVINPRMHLRPDKQDTTIKNNTYFNQEKYMNNYELIFTKEEIESYPVDIQGGRFNRANFEINQ